MGQQSLTKIKKRIKWGQQSLTKSKKKMVLAFSRRLRDAQGASHPQNDPLKRRLRLNAAKYVVIGEAIKEGLKGTHVSQFAQGRGSGPADVPTGIVGEAVEKGLDRAPVPQPAQRRRRGRADSFIGIGAEAVAEGLKRTHVSQPAQRRRRGRADR